jgi:hypothetical protein
MKRLVHVSIKIIFLYAIDQIYNLIELLSQTMNLDYNSTSHQPAARAKA